MLVDICYNTYNGIFCGRLVFCVISHFITSQSHNNKFRASRNLSTCLTNYFFCCCCILFFFSWAIFTLWSFSHHRRATLSCSIDEHQSSNEKFILVPLVDLLCRQPFSHEASLVAFHYPLLINVSPRAHGVQ